MQAMEPLAGLVERKLGKRLSPCALWRWHRKGLRGGIRLRVMRIGRGLFSCDDWWNEFASKLNTEDPVFAVPIPPAATEAELRAAGLLN
jgi:hypothetical protein